MEIDVRLLESTRVAVRDAVEAYLARNPGMSLAGYALLTDDGLGTLSSMAITSAALASSDDQDLLFTATDWPDEVGTDALAPIDEQLRTLQSAGDFATHVEVAFATLVEALASLRREGLFASDTFLDVLSTDPSPQLEALQLAAIRSLNPPRLVEARSRFIERWARVS